MSSQTLILGIDGGGTKTIVWLAANHNCTVLGRGVAGPSNQRAVGPRLAMSHLDEALQLAFDNAGINRSTVSAACFGLAGADRESDRSVVLQWAQEARVAHQIRIVNDAVPLLYAAEGDGSGIALIAGTGSLAWGCQRDGRIGRSGGWGYLLGDEGSAYAIGLAALQAVTRQADGRGGSTRLTEAVLTHLSLSQPSDIVAAVYGSEIPRAVIAGLAPLVFLQAELSDEVACEIVRFQATELATMVASVARKLDFGSTFPLAMTGSVLLNQQAYRNEIRRSLDLMGHSVSRCVLVEHAVEGALRIAQQLASNVPEQRT
ncbi:MAG: hypothetical protein JNM43_13995 [Planctomycetaceae bacterium]|nr:hypothetical protein [Planctomycetaceae bacterium]